jgi:hypothetical protein
LGHVQLGGGEGKAQVAGGSLERAQTVKRWQAAIHHIYTIDA